MQAFRSWLSAGILALALSGVTAAAGAEPHAHGAVNFDKFVPGAAEIEGRIIAPCCWTQTIDIHGSPVSTELRQEIRARLSKGEDADSIERSLVERYGPKILAVPPGSHLGRAGGLIALVLGAAGVGAVVLLRRWQRRSGEHEEGVSGKDEGKPTAPDAALDAQLDRELAELDRD